MQFNTKEKESANKAFYALEKKFWTPIMYSSVRLVNGNFTGSGVLVKDADNIPGIITAKHNLCVNSDIDTPLVWNGEQTADLIVKFLTGLIVGYNALNIEQNPLNEQFLYPTNSDIEFRKGWESWDNDLMFISFKEDLPILEWAKENANRQIDYTKNGIQFYKQNLTGKEVFITGFGDMFDGTGKQTSLSHPFQVRNATITQKAQPVMRHQSPEATFDNVVSASASNGTSTAPGDSGGPMFCMDKGILYLLGVTLGANFAPEAILPDKPIVSNESTYLYDQGKLF